MVLHRMDRLAAELPHDLAKLEAVLRPGSGGTWKV